MTEERELMIKFGDVIYFNDDYYIYLAQKDDKYTYYFAKIIADPDTIKVLIQKKEHYKPCKHNPAKENLGIYLACLVILTTDDFKDEVAFLSGPDQHDVPLEEIIGSLNGEDKDAIKQEILENQDAFPPFLVSYIKELE